MAKGGKGGRGVVNGPSKTGNPSGKGRGNNPARTSGGVGGLGFGGSVGGGSGGSPATVEPPSVLDVAYAAQMARMDAGIKQTHDTVRAIRTARESLPAEEAAALEEVLRAKLAPQQSKMVSVILKNPESWFSKQIRGKR